MDYNWSAAEPLLRPHDRFTRAMIKRDFETQLIDSASAQGVDIGHGLRALPVASNRYTVIFRQPSDHPNEVQVTAVVAAQTRGEHPAALRRKLEKAVSAESHGLIQLL